MRLKLFLSIIVVGLLLAFPTFSNAQKTRGKKRATPIKKPAKKSPAKDLPVENKSSEAEWQKFTSEEGQFSVLLPGKPIVEQQINRTSIGNPISYIYGVAEDSGNVVYNIAAQSAYPDWNFEDDSELRNLQILQNNFPTGNATINNISISGRPGVEWTTANPTAFTAGWIQYGRAYRDMRTRRKYALTVTVYGSDRAKRFAKNADKFMDSFSISSIRTETKIVPKSEVKSSSNLLNDEAIDLPSPQYPSGGKAVRASGEVRVQVKVDTNGNVISATAVSGHPLLRQAAEAAAKKARFKVSDEISLGILVYTFPPK